MLITAKAVPYHGHFSTNNNLIDITPRRFVSGGASGDGGTDVAAIRQLLSVNDGCVMTFVRDSTPPPTTTAAAARIDCIICALNNFICVSLAVSIMR